MKILGEIVEVHRPCLYLPWFHRIAPSLKTGTEVHGVLIPGQTADIYISPYPTSSWTDLWQIKCEFTDRTGLFARLTGLLGDSTVNVNIQAHETSTRPYEGIFEVTLICDMTGYGSSRSPDRDHWDRVGKDSANLNYLRDYLICEMFDDLVFRHGKAQLEITRLRELHRIGQILHKHQSIKALPKSIVDRGMLRMPASIWDSFFRRADALDGDAKSKFWITIASDTEERYMKISTLPPERNVCLLSVFHTDQENQIARFSNLIVTEFRDEANIHCSYLRLQSAGHIAEWRCLLDAPRVMGEAFKTRVKMAFSMANEQWQDPALKVRFNGPIDHCSEPWGEFAIKESDHAD